ncbi:hypothetical protein AB4486_20480 [Vibrio sp. 10N.222.55.C6]|uniref:hypothetical protein n=1 Tax=Vibrio sp. 10N.222.55.C6 TaxID=3229649 RepID=UPI003553623B
MFKLIKTALCAVSLLSFVAHSENIKDAGLVCKNDGNQVQLSIKREQNSGTLVLISATQSKTSISMQGGVAHYVLGINQFPIQLYDQKLDEDWVVASDCTVTLSTQ